MAVTEVAQTATVDANGRAEVSITPYRRQVWTVQQVSVEMETAPPEATCEVRRDNYMISPLVAGADAASGDPPVVLRPGIRLRVIWRNATPGDQGRALFLLDDGV